MKGPRVSIGLPVYNGERYLRMALDSILRQTFPDFVLVISDNGSTDTTQQICEEYAAKDSRIQYHRYPINRGATWNFNNAFRLCEGKTEFFKWAAHDDRLHKACLAHCVEALDFFPDVVLAYPRTVLIDEREGMLRQYQDDLDLASARPSERFAHFHRHFKGQQAMCNPSFGLIRSAVLSCTPLEKSFRGSDMVLLGELCLRGKFCEIPHFLFFRRECKDRIGSSAHSDAEVAALSDPANQGKDQFVSLQWFSGYMSAIQRVPMGFFESMRCYSQMVQWLWWNQWRVRTDIHRAIYSKLLKR